MLGACGYASGRASKVSRMTPQPFPGGATPSWMVDVTVDPEVEAGSATAGRKFPFPAFNATGIEYIGDTDSLQLQGPTYGEMLAIQKAPSQLISGTDYNATTGVLSSTGDGYAEYDVNFEVLPYAVRTDTEMDDLQTAYPLPTACELGRNVIRQYRMGGNQFTIQGGFLYYRDQLNPLGVANRNLLPNPIPEGYPKIFPECNVLYTWKDVPGIPWTGINNCLGKVNSDLSVGGPYGGAPSGVFDYEPDYFSLSYTGAPVAGFPPGTLLFLGTADIKPSLNAVGQIVYTISYAFSYRPSGSGTHDPKGHNAIYRGADDTFQRCVRGAYATSAQASWADILDSADFTQLFRLI